MNHCCQPVSTDRIWKLLIRRFVLYLSVTPQHAVSDNSATFLRLEKVMMEDHRCGINNSNSSNITGEKNSGGSIMSCETPVRIHNRVSSKPDRQKKLLIKTVQLVSTIFLAFNSSSSWSMFTAIFNTWKHVKYPTTSWEGFSELCLSFVDWVCPIGSSDSIIWQRYKWFFW